MTLGDSPTGGDSTQPDPARYPLARPLLLSVEQFGYRTGLHPDLVRRFVALGLLQADRDAAGRMWLRPDQVSAAARMQRLRAGLSLNYSALGLVMDLLDRITELETTLRTRQRSSRWN
jgi:hypothetical protein